jgi:predicted RNase H-like nuclease (RuvC/YqgF family)
LNQAEKEKRDLAMEGARLATGRPSVVALLIVELENITVILEEERKGSKRRVMEFENEGRKSAAEIEGLKKQIENLNTGTSYLTLLIVELQQERTKVESGCTELRKQREEGNRYRIRISELDDGNLNMTLLI